MGHRGYKLARGQPLDLAGTITPVVVTTETSSELVAWCRSRRHHHGGVFAVVPFQSASQSIDRIAMAVLDGLGKDIEFAQQKRSSLLLANAWLALNEHTDALIPDAQHISGYLLPEIADWFSSHGVRPWFVFCHTNVAGVDNTSELGPFVDQLTAAWGICPVSEESLRDAFPDTSTARPDEVKAFPVVPRVDGILFRSTCRQTLDPHDFAVVDQHLRDAYDTATEAFTKGLAARGRHKAAQISREIQHWLRPLIDNAPTIEHVVIAARAIQIAALHHNRLAHVDTQRLISASLLRPRIGSSPTPIWKHLNRYRDPDYGAAAALYLAGIDHTALPDVVISDIHIAGNHASAQDLELPDPGVRFVTAMVNVRLLDGAAADDPLFATHRREGITNHQATRLLTDAGDDNAHPLFDLQHRHSKTGRRITDAQAWLAGFGIQLEHLGNQPHT